MSQALLEQKKNLLQYNQDKNDLLERLCKPLKAYFDIDWFARVTFFLNDRGECVKHVVLGTHIDFLRSHLYQLDNNGKCFTQAIKETPFNTYSYFLWPNLDDCPFTPVKRQQNFVRELDIYKRYEDRVECWGFSSKDSKGIPSVITQASIFPFQKFMAYFDEQQILSQLQAPSVNYSVPFDMSYIQHNANIINGFKSCVRTKKFTLNTGSKFIQLSKREWDCLSGIAQGRTCKEIANRLSLSPRTVETYLNQIKAKTGAPHKSKLIDYFLETTQPHL